MYTVSIHEEGIFPIPKARSNLDIGLPSRTGDDVYLARVEEALAHVRRRFEPEIIVYVAGSDPYKGDPLGSLELRIRQEITFTSTPVGHKLRTCK